MSKYIKLEDAIKAITNSCKDRCLDCEFYWNDECAISDILSDLPTIDIVECKDCVHCADDWNGNQPQFTCELGMCTESVYPNDFCSVGERTEE